MSGLIVGGDVVAVQREEVGRIVAGEPRLKHALVVTGARHLEVYGELDVLLRKHFFLKLLAIGLPLVHELREAHHDVELGLHRLFAHGFPALDRRLGAVGGLRRLSACCKRQEHAERQDQCQVLFHSVSSFSF